MLKSLFCKQRIFVIALAVVASALAVSPVSAQRGSGGDDANIQTSTQENVTTGNSNRSTQQSIQNNESNRRNSAGNSGNVQDSYQVCDTAGDKNACIQQQIQNRRNNRR